MNQNQPTPSPEQSKPARVAYVGFALKQRLAPVLLLALAAGFTVCFFGPFDIFMGNADEFRFPLESFLLYNLLSAIGIAALLVGILLPLRGRVFDIAYAVLFWLTLMLFIQGNYLNTGINSLAGDGMGEDGFGVGKIILNTVIWLLAGGGCVVAAILLRGSAREWIPTVCTIAMVTVLGMQTIPFAVNSLATDVWEKNHSTTLTDAEANEHFLTYKNMEKVSSGKNIIYFVIDRFDYTYYEKAREECPDIFYNLDGFTYYDDMLSLYPRTYPSIAYMLTGFEHDFNDNRPEYLEEAFRNSPFLKTLKENNYHVNIYSDSYYSYRDAIDMEEYIKNSTSSKSFYVANTDRLAGDMMRISLFRYLPLAAKDLSGNISTSDFDKYLVYESDYPKYTSDMRDAYEYLNKNPMTVFDGANNFTFIHISGCHLPLQYDENFKDATGNERQDSNSAMKQSFKIINRYLDQLKELGLYKDATIVITGDHGWHGGSDTDFLRAQVTALFFKQSGAAGTELVTNQAEVTQGDIIPSILYSEGIDAEGFGKPLWEYGTNEGRVRRFNFQSLQTNSQGNVDYEVLWFEITGRARDINNWRKVSSGEYVGNIYQ